MIFKSSAIMASSMFSIQCMAFLLLILIKHSLAGCPFQNPFWFYDKPVVVNKYDESGEIVANTIRVMWGRMENFKCVDYFQVEYFQRLNPEQTVAMTPRINRHRRSVEIEVVPCTIYFFKVIASEDWNGMREDFKVFSEVVRFRVDYTPKFITPPMVKERGRKFPPPLPEPEGTGNPVIIPQEPEEFTIKVGWRLRDIDYPICLDYFELDYYDTSFNSSKFLKPFKRPFQRQKFEFEIKSTAVPCEPDLEFMLRVFGLNKKFSLAYWTPPSCVVTTPAPTTTEALPEDVSQVPDEVVEVVGTTTESLAEQMEIIQAENERLQSKIDGLKQEYEKIGLQVFAAFKGSFFESLENFLLSRKSEGVDGDGLGLGGNNTDPLFS